MGIHHFKLEAPMSLSSGIRLAIAFTVLSFVLFLMWRIDPLVAEEDHLMEWMQAAFLALAAALHFRRGRRVHDCIISWTVFSGLALLSISFLARELDVDSWGSPSIAEPIQTVFRAIIVILWLAFARTLIKNTILLWKSLVTTLGTPVVVLAFIGCCFFLVSWPFEKELFPISSDASKFWGQLAQISASSLIFSSSLARLFHPALAITKDAWNNQTVPANLS